MNDRTIKPNTMNIALRLIGKPDVVATIQWDSQAGALVGGARTLLKQISDMASMAKAAGRLGIPSLPTNTFKISDPLKSASELSVVLAFLGYVSDDLPLPSPGGGKSTRSDLEVVY